MKSKIALILCIVMCFSALVSCKGADDSSSNISSDISSSSVTESETESLESSAESSEESSEPEPTPVIPENAEYFRGTYITYWWNAAILEDADGSLNEWYSGETFNGIRDLYRDESQPLDTKNVYYYVGIKFLSEREVVDEKPSNIEYKLSHMDEILESVGFIPVDDKYLHEDYHTDVYGFPNTDINADEFKGKLLEHAQNLVPGADFSNYRGLEPLMKFLYHATGYITLDGLETLGEKYGKIAYTWLPAPDDRERLLTCLDLK